jgi:hypothetical protein
MKRIDYPYEERGPRRAPDLGELRAFALARVREGGRRRTPTAARAFQERARAEVMEYPALGEPPRWYRALAERKASPDEVARVMAERLLRAPTEENQRLALVLANEISRQPDGSELVRSHLNDELVARINGRARK